MMFWCVINAYFVDDEYNMGEDKEKHAHHIYTHTQKQCFDFLFFMFIVRPRANNASSILWMYTDAHA